MHNGLLIDAGAKMSKSLGNITTVRELLDEGAQGEEIRLALLATHYRDPLDWTNSRLRQARQTLDRFYRALSLPRAAVLDRFGEAEEALRPVREALADDMNTPLALAELHELAGAVNRASTDAERSAMQGALASGWGWAASHFSEIDRQNKGAVSFDDVLDYVNGHSPMVLRPVQGT